MFEIGGPDTTNGVVSADVNLSLYDGEEYEDDYDLVSPPNEEDIGTTTSPYASPRRGDTGIYKSPRIFSPQHLATVRPPGPRIERNASFQLPVEKFPQQHPQVIDVDEVEETEVGKAA